MSLNTTRLDDCGCCGTGMEEPAVTNPPGLSTLAYRGGTHGTVLRRMLAALAERLPALTLRSTDDAVVALLDAWATVADVITFYQERIANEGFLRTATERRSVLELAREIGYELQPGVAATTYLAFSVETAPGAPTTAVVGAGTKVRSIPGQGELPQTFETSVEIIADVARNEITLRQRCPQQTCPDTTQLYLAGVDTGLRPGDAILIVGDERKNDPASNRWHFRILRSVQPLPSPIRDEPSATLIAWDMPLGKDPAYECVEVHAFRLRAALFGYNAPDWRTMPEDVRKSYAPEDYATRKQWPNFELPGLQDHPEIDLDAVYPAVATGSWLVLRQPGDESELNVVEQADLSAGHDFGITSKTTRVTLKDKADLSCFGIRETAVYTQTELLALADEPIVEAVTEPEFILDRQAPLAKGMPVIVQGTTVDGLEVTEVSRVAAVTEAAGVTTVTLDTPLNKPLRPDSVRILGNIVQATHGETVEDEALGSGDGTATHQRFTLVKKDLTHVSAPTPRGVTDTLEVRVDGVAWTETPSLFTVGPHDRAYVVRIDDDAKATVVFGDGERGARLPTGQENVRARYRSGIGPGGNVPAGAVSLLQQRPLGISTVTNPLAAAGGTAPENLQDARVNAPLTVLTLDRVVSLRDYEDFARAFGGIAKARAVALWGATALFVHVTVAAPGGAEVAATMIENLRAAIDSVRDLAREVRVSSYRPLRFEVAVAVLADTAYLNSAVHRDVADALQAAYAFERRSFGQPVTAAEAITVVQGVPGVVAARLTALHLANAAPRVEEVIVAHDARLEGDGVIAAELLLVDVDHIVVSEMAP